MLHSCTTFKCLTTERIPDNQASALVHKAVSLGGGRYRTLVFEQVSSDEDLTYVCSFSRQPPLTFPTPWLEYESPSSYASNLPTQMYILLSHLNIARMMQCAPLKLQPMQDPRPRAHPRKLASRKTRDKTCSSFPRGTCRRLGRRARRPYRCDGYSSSSAL